MSDKTSIEWTDATWNPIRGCSRVSEGCRHCYAEGVAYRFSGPGQPYEGLVRIGADGERRREWNGQVQFVEKHLLDPLRWKKPRRIFVNSMSDLFHENVTDDMRDRIFAVMALCPQHTFQILTKRSERMREYLTAQGRTSAIYNAAAILIEGDWKRMPTAMPHHRSSGEGWWPLHNVWLGVSVENQQAADERIPLLLQTPAAVRFISAEPLLGPVNLDCIHREPDQFDRAMPGFDECASFHASALCGSIGATMKQGDISWSSNIPDNGRKLDWVIVGGESGSAARPMHPDSVRSLRDQCMLAAVPFFFKQWGEWVPFSTAHLDRVELLYPGLSQSTPTCLVKKDGRVVRPYCMDDAPGQEMLRVGKKAAGHLLDGQRWHEFPSAARG